jgi:AraC-like DNA-binding protein
MVLSSYDILDLNNFPKPQIVEPDQQSGRSNNFVDCYYPKVGSISFRSELFPHMHLMNIHWSSEQPVELWDTASADTININFHLSGNLDTQFSGLKHELNMRPRKHNLVYSPEGGFVNKIASGLPIEMFHLSVDKQFFISAIGSDDSWSEKVQNDLMHNRPFVGVQGTLDIMPQMLRLISDIKSTDLHAPMRNLMIQSKLLELLALQIGQVRGPVQRDSELRADEVEKLYKLRSFLDSNFLSDLTLSQLSRTCLLNEFKVKRGFKALFGQTVFGYLRKLRMDYAQRLLLDSKLTVEEVASELGYEHAQHFSTAFKKFTGRNPSSLQSKIAYKVII